MRRCSSFRRRLPPISEAILERSLSEFGAAIAERTRRRIEQACEAIAAGRLAGHKRSDVAFGRPLLFIRADRRLPFMIAYHERSLKIARIIDGRRDFDRLFSEKLNWEDRE